MCLIIRKNNPEPIMAKQDIVCYKVLRKQLYNGALLAPIYCFVYDFDVIYGTPEEYFEHVSICDDGCVLAEYGFHTLVTFSDAVQYKKHLSEALHYTYDYVIAKCIIPSGSRYYTGKQKFAHNEVDSPNGYCSEAIRIDEIVNENENK